MTAGSRRPNDGYSRTFGKGPAVRRAGAAFVLVASASLFLLMLLSHLSYPLLWNDEAETAMYAERILRFGYPKVHDERNAVYELGAPFWVGVKEPYDAYIGSTWGQYYVGAVGALLARQVQDPYDKTLRLRLPFALAGALAIAICAGLLWMLLRERPRSAVAAMVALVVLLAGSVPLLLHLREARYYSLATLLLVAIVALEVLHYARIWTSGWIHWIATPVLLLLLFNVFLPGYFALAAGLGAHGAVLSLRPRIPMRTRMRDAASAIGPVLISAALVAPLLVFFETFRISAKLASPEGTGLGHYLSNAEQLVAFLAGHDLLLACVAIKLARIALGTGPAGSPIAEETRGLRAAARLLTILIIAHVLVMARVPLVYERYVVMLVPLLGISLVLDTVIGWRLASRWSDPRRRRLARIALVAALIAAFGWTAPQRISDLRGRLTEMTTRYRGPMDFAVEWLASHYADTQQLVVATNYEATVLMYYLGCRVVVGYWLTQPTVPVEIVPDVILPRPDWLGVDWMFAVFGRYGPYLLERLPVAGLPYNNIPELSPGSAPVVHQFRTPAPATPEAALEIYWRAEPVESASPRGGSSAVGPKAGSDNDLR